MTRSGFAGAVGVRAFRACERGCRGGRITTATPTPTALFPFVLPFFCSLTSIAYGRGWRVRTGILRDTPSPSASPPTTLSFFLRLPFDGGAHTSTWQRHELCKTNVRAPSHAFASCPLTPPCSQS